MASIEEVRILDATVKDGGLANDFYFTGEFVKTVYETNLASDDDIRSIVGKKGRR